LVAGKEIVASRVFLEDSGDFLFLVEEPFEGLTAVSAAQELVTKIHVCRSTCALIMVAVRSWIPSRERNH
jgi:hypothetical protein